MQKTAVRNILVSMVLILLSSPLAFADEWEQLGQWNVKRVKNVADISVKTETPYKAIKLNIGTVGIYVRSISVFFTDGDEFVTEINKSISPNSDTQSIFLPGNEKAIRKVRFNYKSNKRSIITLWASTDTCQTEAPSSDDIEEDE